MYPKAFIVALDNPKDLWDNAFRNHISAACRHLLIALFFTPGFGASIEALRAAFEPLHQRLSQKLGDCIVCKHAAFEAPSPAQEGESGVKMAEAFWVTFRIASTGDYDARYKKLNDDLSAISDSGKWWIESTSFYLFESALSIDDVAQTVANAFDPERDLALVGMPNFKSARAVGAITDGDLFKLLPFAKKL